MSGAPRYIVAADNGLFSRHQSARLYKSTAYRNRYTLEAQGSVEQMQGLADELNGDTE